MYLASRFEEISSLSIFILLEHGKIELGEKIAWKTLESGKN